MKSLYLLVMLSFMLTACNPAATPATQTTFSATFTETPFTSPTLIPATPTIFSTVAPEVLPTLPPAPNAHAQYFMKIGQRLNLGNIYMTDEQNGWAIDQSTPLNHILHTHDGGHSWKDVTPYYGYGYPIYFASGFFALDANTAWVTTPEVPACSVQNFNCTIIPNTGLIWHTTDGGRTWQGQFVTPLPPGYTPVSIQFLDAQTGWLLAFTINGGDLRYHLYQTTDGGTHWSTIMDISSRTTPADPHEKNITAVAFQDPQMGWMSTSEICCEAHLIKEWSIYRSTDAGSNWDKFYLPAPDPLPETFLHNTAQCAVQDMQVILPDVLDTTVYCYVYEELSKPEFYFHYHSSDGGDHWVSFQKPGDIQFIDASLGWRMIPRDSAYDLERTQDGGVTWTIIKTVQWNGDLNFVNKFVGWALAASGPDAALVHTVDGGRTWEEIKPIVTAN